MTMEINHAKDIPFILDLNLSKGEFLISMQLIICLPLSLPMHKMASFDLARLLKSEEIQSVIREPK